MFISLGEGAGLKTIKHIQLFSIVSFIYFVQ